MQDDEERQEGRAILVHVPTQERGKYHPVPQARYRQDLRRPLQQRQPISLPDAHLPKPLQCSPVRSMLRDFHSTAAVATAKCPVEDAPRLPPDRSSLLLAAEDEVP